MVRQWMFLVLLVLFTAGVVRGDVRLPAVFSDQMVLQRGMRVPVWGWADAGEQVAVQFGGHDVSATADADGRWRVDLPAMDASNDGRKLTVRGDNTVAFEGVLVGEVWLCSGQSNMFWPVERSMNAQAELAACDHASIRLLKVLRHVADQPRDDAEVVGWSQCSPPTVASFSAVGYFFGRDLREALDVPIGLIQSSWGGTPAEAWTSNERLEADPELAPIVERYEQAAGVYDERKAAYDKQLAEHRQKVREARDAGADAATIRQIRAPRLPMGPEHPRRPAGLYNAMIHSIAPYAVRGAIWYQGEANAGRGVQYRTLLPTLIDNWRDLWGQGAFHFGIVQLANYRQPADEPGDDHWAELREAQALTAAADPRAGLALAIDIGEADDIHPKNKQEVGRRLALWARAKVYGEPIVYSGPVYRDMRVDEQGRVHLLFDHVAGGLELRGKEKKSFAIAGADRQWVWADAKVAGDVAIVWSDAVADPVAVRYAWSINPPANLYNDAGLPAVPFRTDNWRVASEDQR